jgi:hypothetical protein
VSDLTPERIEQIREELSIPEGEWHPWGAREWWVAAGDLLAALAAAENRADRYKRALTVIAEDDLSDGDDLQDIARAVLAGDGKQ